MESTEMILKNGNKALIVYSKNGYRQAFNSGFEYASTFSEGNRGMAKIAMFKTNEDCGLFLEENQTELELNADDEEMSTLNLL